MLTLGLIVAVIVTAIVLEDTIIQRIDRHAAASNNRFLILHKRLTTMEARIMSELNDLDAAIAGTVEEDNAILAALTAQDQQIADLLSRLNNPSPAGIDPAQVAAEVEKLKAQNAAVAAALAARTPAPAPAPAPPETPPAPPEATGGGEGGGTP